MKKRLLIINVALYALMYSMSLYGVGFYYGERWDNYYRPGMDAIIFPVLHIILLVLGVYFLCNRNKITPTGYSLLGGFTVIHIPLAILCISLKEYVKHRVAFGFPPNHFLMFIWAYMPAIIICIIYAVCAVLTNRENKEIRRKRRETASQ